MTTTKIEIDMDTNCRRCGRPGACPSGYCLKCILKNLDEGKYDHIIFKERGETNHAKSKR
jgi:hypothetical protein